MWDCKQARLNFKVQGAISNVAPKAVAPVVETKVRGRVVVMRRTIMMLEEVKEEGSKSTVSGRSWRLPVLTVDELCLSLPACMCRRWRSTWRAGGPRGARARPSAGLWCVIMHALIPRVCICPGEMRMREGVGEREGKAVEWVYESWGNHITVVEAGFAFQRSNWRCA